MIILQGVVAGLLSILGLAVVQAASPSTAKPSGEDWKTRSLYILETKTLEGEPAKLSTYDGKVTLVVNLASKCGYTPQYEGLEKLYNEFKDKGLVILGFPSNDFGGQEPGTAKEIREFCTSKYKVTFPLFEKVSVKPGDGQSVVYQALQAKTGEAPKWNFCKYLVSRDGTRAEFFDSKVTPQSDELRKALERELAAK
jgi:glutathione peroxidase